jgi:hypothetical protein
VELDCLDNLSSEELEFLGIMPLPSGYSEFFIAECGVCHKRHTLDSRYEINELGLTLKESVVLNKKSSLKVRRYFQERVSG